MVGIDRPPVASTRRGARNAPRELATRKSWSRSTADTTQPVTMVTPAASHSSISSFTICLAEPSQNSWPSFFSCQAMPWRSTRARKSSGE